MKMLRVLILARGIKPLGGVVNVINALISNFSETISVDRFLIGSRIRKSNIFRRIFITLIDCLRLLNHVKKNNYDIIHINPSIVIFSLLRDGLFIISLHLTGLKNIVVFIHGWNSILFNKIKRNILLRLIFLKIFGKAKAIIVLGSNFKSELIDIGFRTDNIHILSTMFDGELFKTAYPKKKKNDVKLLFLSRVIKEKGIFELVDAFEMVRNDFSELSLFIAGDGSDLDILSRYVSKKSLDDSIVFTGYVKNKKKATIFREADIFILPSYHGEGCPVSLIEAMAAGLAVITTPVGGIPDIIDDDVNGILLNYPAPSQIAAALKRLLNDRKLCKTIQDNNRRKAWKHYEAKTVTGIIENIYSQVAEHV
jgi:glycosyltransferase involved in cell wall biosynthesis